MKYSSSSSENLYPFFIGIAESGGVGDRLGTLIAPFVFAFFDCGFSFSFSFSFCFAFTAALDGDASNSVVALVRLDDDGA